MSASSSPMFVDGLPCTDVNHLLECSICTELLDDPHSCCRDGHLYCLSCITEWLKRNGSCPDCRAKASVRQLTRSLATKRIMDAMIVRCPNASSSPPPRPETPPPPLRKRSRTDAIDRSCRSSSSPSRSAETVKSEYPPGRKGASTAPPPPQPPPPRLPSPSHETDTDFECGWTGRLCDLSKHRDDCPLEKVLCSCGCGDLFDRGLVDMYECPNRKVSCEQCGEVMVSRQMKAHDRTCLHALLQCPLACGALVQRCEIDTHVDKECGQADTECPFASYGCTTSLKRDDLEAHMHVRGAEHAAMLSGRVGELECELEHSVSTVSNTVQNQISTMWGVFRRQSTSLTDQFESVSTTLTARLDTAELDVSSQKTLIGAAVNELSRITAVLPSHENIITTVHAHDKRLSDLEAEFTRVKARLTDSEAEVSSLRGQLESSVHELETIKEAGAAQAIDLARKFAQLEAKRDTSLELELATVRASASSQCARIVMLEAIVMASRCEITWDLHDALESIKAGTSSVWSPCFSVGRGVLDGVSECYSVALLLEVGATEDSNVGLYIYIQPAQGTPPTARVTGRICLVAEMTECSCWQSFDDADNVITMPSACMSWPQLPLDRAQLMTMASAGTATVTAVVSAVPTRESLPALPSLAPPTVPPPPAPSTWSPPISLAPPSVPHLPPAPPLPSPSMLSPPMAPQPLAPQAPTTLVKPPPTPSTFSPPTSLTPQSVPRLPPPSSLVPPRTLPHAALHESLWLSRLPPPYAPRASVSSRLQPQYILPTPPTLPFPR